MKKLIGVALLVIIVFIGWGTSNYNTKNNEKKDENIFGTISFEPNVVVEPTSENVFANSEAIAVVEVKEIKGTVLKKGSPTSEIEMVVSLLENKSDFKLENEFTIWSQGGNVTVEDFMKARPEEALKMGVENIPESERKTQYIEFDSAYFYTDINVGDKILVALSSKGDGTFFTTVGGYSIFKAVEGAKSANDFKNVVSDEKISF